MSQTEGLAPCLFPAVVTLSVSVSGPLLITSSLFELWEMNCFSNGSDRVIMYENSGAGAF